MQDDDRCVIIRTAIKKTTSGYLGLHPEEALTPAT